jgi:hypothetical protein
MGALNLGALSNQNFASTQISSQAVQYNKSIKGIQGHGKRRNSILIHQKSCQEKNDF